MTPTLPQESWKPNWPELWRFGACWAGRPVGGVHLPGPERANVMLAVMEQFMNRFPQLPGELQAHSFIQSAAVRLALEATHRARKESGDATLWHDNSHRPTSPALSLAELQRTNAEGQLISSQWQDLLSEMKPRAIGFLRGEGVPETDAEDIFSEAMAGMVQSRKSGTAVIQDLLVYEQVPPLFLNIVRRRLSNHIRHRQAEKRAARQTVSLEGGEDVASCTDQTVFSSWAAEEADPFSGMTFARLAEECSQGLSALQQRILSVLYVEESATYMEVAAAPWFAQAAGIKPGASSSTLRRALDREHDSALDHLAQSLGLNRPRASATTS